MFKRLADIDEVDAPFVGGKAFNCAWLARAGFRVPDGLVVTTQADDKALNRLADHPWFAAFPASQRFAVRSSGIGEDSAGHSFAGVHDTFLDVAIADVAAAVRACLSSTGSEPARAYRETRGLAADAAAGVLIQPMIAAAVSGVGFTVHPVTGADELLIDCAPGVGDQLVSGRIEPDHYRLQKRSRAVIEQRVVAGRQPLSHDELSRLADVLVRIEQHYGVPQDIEWAADETGPWILQSRPITTTAAVVGLDIEWSRANLAEVFPDQMSPQALDGYDFLLNEGQRQFAGGLLGPEEVFGPPFKVFGGRMYINLSQLRRATQIGGTPAAALLRSLGHAEAITAADEIARRPPIATIVRLFPDLARLVWRDLRAPRLVQALDIGNAAAIARLAVPQPDALDDRAIVDLLSEWRRGGADHMVVILTLGSLMVIEEQLRKALRAAGQDYEQFVYAQLAAGEPSVSTRQAFDLVALADVARQEPAAAAYLEARPDRFDDYRSALAGTAFLEAFDRFLEAYGHRGLYESDWALPRFREDPTPLLFAIRTHIRNPPAETRAAIAARLERTAADAWAALHASLTWWQRLTLQPRVRFLVARLKQRYVLREHCRSELVRVLFHARRLQLVLAARFAGRGWIDAPSDYFLLLTKEIGAVVGGEAEPAGLREIVRRRRQQRAAEARLTMPLYMRQSDVARVLSPAAAGAQAGEARGDASAPSVRAGRLTGLCVSRGVVTAEVVVIRDPREFALMKRGAILVAPATDPSWTPLFTLAAGVVVEVGGMLSHASTVAREYGLPALANVKQATTRLRTGDRVRLDASAGHADLL